MIKKFAFVAEGDVFGVWTIDTEDTTEDTQTANRVLAGMMSNPIIVAVPDEVNVETGWTWNGSEFAEGTL